MYSLNVRDHFMIAHSFQGEVFGPAQRLHGATYVVDATFSRDPLDADGLVLAEWGQLDPETRRIVGADRTGDDTSGSRGRTFLPATFT